MSDNSEKKIIIIAGLNGAGKTTFAEEFLPREAACPAFITPISLQPDWLPLSLNGQLSGPVD